MASFTLKGALVHLHFSGLLIDLWIMVLQPDIAEDHALLPEVGDGEERPLRVGLIIENYIYHFRDLPCFIRGAVYIEHWYGVRDIPGANTLCTNKVLIYEVACSSRVQKHLDGMHLTSVSGTDLDRKDDRYSVGIKGIGGELSG